MSLLMKLPIILEDSYAVCKEILSAPAGDAFSVTEIIGKEQQGTLPANTVALGDNIAFIKYLLTEKHLGGKVDLIYIDPPFFSRADYGTEIKLHAGKDTKIPAMKQKAYHDTWENGMEEYLRMLDRKRVV